MQSLADKLIRLGIEGANRKLNVADLLKKYVPKENRTLVVEVVNGISLGYGFYLDAKEGKLKLCNPREMGDDITVRVPIKFTGILILLDPQRNEGPMDIYTMGLMPGLAGYKFLSHLRLLHVIFSEMKKSLREFSGLSTKGV